VVLAAVGVAATLGGFVALRSADTRRIADALDYTASQVVVEIDNRLERDLWAAAQLRALYSASDHVDRDEFTDFAAGVLSQHPHVRWVGWVPSVPEGDVAAFVDHTRADGLPGFSLRGFPDEGSARLAASSPLTYVAPPSYASELGLDLSTSAPWATALRQSGEENRVRLYELPALYPAASTVPHGFVVTVVAPVRGTQDGFIVAQVSTAGLLDGAFTEGLDVYVRDVHGHVVAHRPLVGVGEVDDEMSRALGVPLGPNGWEVGIRPGERFTSLRRSGLPWFVLALGLVGTLFIWIYVRALTLATRRATRAAAELLAAQRALERETREREVLEERVRHAQKMEAMGTLAGGIAHDFNNILSAILGYTDLAASEAAPGSDQREFLDEVSRAGRRAADLVAQILAFSRQTERERRPIQLHTVVREAVKLLRGSIPPTIEIRDQIDRNDPRVLADATEIHQVVMNLCTNAYHAMRDEGGTLVVALHAATLGPDEVALDPRLRPGDYVRLSVSDTGCGMSAETRRRIFEPYFTPRELGDGTGLGLATVHTIVDALDGVIHVYSEEGQGSTFNVFLPVHGEGDRAQAGHASHQPELRGSERVLLVDDEAALTAFAGAALERFGYSVTATTDSVSALSLMSQDPGRFDVVITDQMMPGIRGSELARELRRLRPALPIILCSGFGDVLNEQRGDSGLFDRCVTKPVIASDLAVAIRAVVRARPHLARSATVAVSVH